MVANKREGAAEAALSRLTAVLAEIARNSPALEEQPENPHNKDPLSPEMEKNRNHKTSMDSHNILRKQH
jgi:hypothetical protein